MTESTTPQRIATAHGTVCIATRAQIERCTAWRSSFAQNRKDSRYYEIVEDTILQNFDYRYFIIEDPKGEVRAIQPFFLLNQDLLQGAGSTVQKFARRIRKILPRALTIRTLMVGCAAGEGHLDQVSDEHADWIGKCLHEALGRYAKRVKARMIVLKEFPFQYRRSLARFASNGYTRVPSLPMTRLSIGYSSFEEYMTRALSKATRKDLRRKFRDAAEAEPISLEVMQDITPIVDEVYPLYLNVYNRSPLQFEKLTREYLCRLGTGMPDKVRFFVWRQKGKAIAFSVCMLGGDTIYDEYLGLDYSVALDLHLYFYTLRDVVEWAMRNECKWYVSSALNYDPKRRLKCELVPLDLYVTHTFRPANFILRKVLPFLEPTRNDATLREFPNFDALWAKE